MPNQWYDIDTWQWTDDDSRQWGFTIEVPGTEEAHSLRQIWTDENYVYAATISGLDIIDIGTEVRQSFANDSSGFMSVWSSADRVFMASPDKGIRSLKKEKIGPADVTAYLHDYARYPDITSDNVKYLHGNTNKMICCTDKGVDILRLNTGYVTHTSVSGAYKCFATPEHDYFYYTVSGTSYSGTAVSGTTYSGTTYSGTTYSGTTYSGTTYSGTPYLYHSINRLNGNTGDWDSPDVVYTTLSGFMSMATCLTDFYVTEHTATSGINNTLFAATDIGVFVYDEETTDYKLFTVAS